MARNPAQRFSARFGRSGVAITAGSARFAICVESVRAWERAAGARAVSPVASADRVSYARGPVREWWANGPLGLEQGFDIARRPAGSGALTLSLAVSGSVRLDHGTVLLPGGLRYAGLRATDARGHSLRAWLQVRDGRVLVRVDDRGARYPLRIDPFVEQAELTRVTASAAVETAPTSSATRSRPRATRLSSARPTTKRTRRRTAALYTCFRCRPLGGRARPRPPSSRTQPSAATWSWVSRSRSRATATRSSPVRPRAARYRREINGEDTQGTVDVFTTTGRWASTSTPTARLTVAGSPATESPLGGELGWSVAISGTHDRCRCALRRPTYPSYGEAYVFDEPRGGWSGPQTQTAELSASDPSNPNGEDVFGWSVGISGTTIVVGAYQQGAGRIRRPGRGVRVHDATAGGATRPRPPS